MFMVDIAQWVNIAVVSNTVSAEFGQRPVLQLRFRRSATPRVEADSLSQFLLRWLTCFYIVLPYFRKE
jgi:hypothetical protein